MKNKRFQLPIKQSFITGTMILLVAGILNRLLGFVPRITLPRVIGAEGVGLYQMGYPFFIVVLTIITSGIPLAVAKLVAEAESQNNEKRSRSILFISLIFVIVLGIIFAMISYWFAPWIVPRLFTDERVYYTFLSMTPLIPMAAVSAVLRGYFQGRHNMIPTASSQIVETSIRIIAMLAFSFMLLPRGIEYAAAGAMLGVVLGELGGMLILIRYLKKSKSAKLKISQPSTELTSADVKFSSIRIFSDFKRLMKISIPVSAASLVGSGSYFMESIMIIQSLAVAGVVTVVATAQYGILQGMVIPILLLPGALTFSLAVSLVPSLSEAAARNDMKTIHKRLHQSLRLALVTGAPFAVIMYILAEPLCYYLYGDPEVGMMLRRMAPAALFLYLQAPLKATLQALDRPGDALLNTFIGASLKLVLIYLLATQPEWGIYGAVLAINVNIVLVTILHWSSTSRLLHISLPISDFFKVGGGIIVMACVCYLTMFKHWIELDLLRFIIACLAGLGLYILCMVWFKLIDLRDIERIPWIGSRLVRRK